MDENKKLFIGIGNPDEHYKGTRHNVGIDVIEQLADELDIELPLKPKFGAAVGQGKTGFFLAQSLSYMNDSGWPVKTIANYYKIPPENIWIIHDDFDVPLGTVKESFDSRSAGHNGVESIIRELGTKKFNRIRVGIKSSADIATSLEKFVLARFGIDEIDKIKEATEQTKKIIKTKIIAS
ncbi:aminoacyl-tRNA hydrolase [bacterium]|nr:MAG: aminoacyl-tRNA hydrolase [bacterium]